MAPDKDAGGTVPTPNDRPLNEVLLELHSKVNDAIYSEDNTGSDRPIKEMLDELRADPIGGPKVAMEQQDNGVWLLTTAEPDYPDGIVGSVFEDTGEGEPPFDDYPRRP